jgi:hypothetical protein
MTLLKKILQFTKHTGFDQKLSLQHLFLPVSLAGFFLSIVLAFTVFDVGG